MYQGTQGGVGVYQREAIRINILSGHDPLNSNFPALRGPVADGITIRSGQLISKNAAGAWIRGYDPSIPNSAVTLSFALQDSAELDVLEGGQLTGLPCSTPNIVIQTGWFERDASESYAVQGTYLVPSGTTGNVKPLAYANMDNDFVIPATASSTTAVTSSDTSNVLVGDGVSGDFVPAGTIVTAIGSGTAMTLSASTTGAVTSLTISKSGFSFTKAGGATTDDSATITMTSTLGVRAGDVAAGTGIPTGTRVLSVTNSTTAVLDAVATATGSSLTFTFTRESTNVRLPVVGIVSQSQTVPKTQPENVIGSPGNPRTFSKGVTPDANGAILALTVRTQFLPENIASTLRTA